MKNKYFAMVVIVCMTSTPIYAGDSIFDTYSSKLKKIAEEAKKKIEDYYGYSKEDPNKNNPPINPPVINPPIDNTPTVVKDPIKEKFEPCGKFLGYMYDVSYEKDPKKIATIYLNASLDLINLHSSLDDKVSESELAERNKCVELALSEGADPNSNGRDKTENGSMFEASVPLVIAVRNENEAAVKLLLDYKANPNVSDSTLGNAIPLLNIALNLPKQEIALDLINAGADLNIPNLLWMAASSADEKVVELLIDKKVPVNQLAKFSSYEDEAGQTALDTSEYKINALEKYQKNIASNNKLSLQDKLMEANNILYYQYPLKPQLKMKDDVNPDAVIQDLYSRQLEISKILKDAGGKCNEENCGIIEISN